MSSLLLEKTAETSMFQPMEQPELQSNSSIDQPMEQAELQSNSSIDQPMEQPELQSNSSIDQPMEQETLTINNPKFVFEIGRCGAYDTSTFNTGTTPTFCKNMNYDNINDDFIASLGDCLLEPELTLFRFLCSEQCCSNKFKNQDNVFKLIKELLKHRVLLEFSDFSLGALIAQWNKYLPEMICPWKLLPITTSGEFTMSGLKTDFESSIHPTLQTIAQLSDTDIEIKFNNAGGTILYEINEESPIVPTIISQGFIGRVNETKYLVHSSTKIGESTFITLNSHWCNLTSVESNVNTAVLRDYILRTEGENSAMEFDNSMEENIGNPVALKRDISESVRRMVSGQTQKKKTKFVENDSDDECCSSPPVSGRQNTNAW